MFILFFFFFQDIIQVQNTESSLNTIIIMCVCVYVIFDKTSVELQDGFGEHKRDPICFFLILLKSESRVWRGLAREGTLIGHYKSF